MLFEGSPELREVAGAVWELAEDEMELEV